MNGEITGAIATAVSEDEVAAATMNNIETYMKKHKIHFAIKDSIVQLCVRCPDNPYAFLRDYYDNIEKVLYQHVYFSYYKEVLFQFFY